MSPVAIIQSVLAILLIIVILIQQRAAGIGGAMGGGSESSFSTRRGTEKTIFKATIVITVLFFAISLVRLLL